jgi:hypothetical protein
LRRIHTGIIPSFDKDGRAMLAHGRKKTGVIMRALLKQVAAVPTKPIGLIGFRGRAKRLS